MIEDSIRWELVVPDEEYAEKLADLIWTVSENKASVNWRTEDDGVRVFIRFVRRIGVKG